MEAAVRNGQAEPRVAADPRDIPANSRLIAVVFSLCLCVSVVSHAQTAPTNLGPVRIATQDYARNLRYRS
jgi:hypothetical protein